MERSRDERDHLDRALPCGCSCAKQLECRRCDEYTILGVLASLAEVPLNDGIRAAASALAPVELRTLDAIHLASALALGDDLAGVLTYDSRMQRAALASGISVLAPEPAPAKPDDQPETTN